MESKQRNSLDTQGHPAFPRQHIALGSTVDQPEVDYRKVRLELQLNQKRPVETMRRNTMTAGRTIESLCQK